VAVELGVIEGYYGTPWSWAERADQVRFLSAHSYGFYLYAPKADAFLRKRWREPYPLADAERLQVFAGQCADAGVRFGVGLSPFEVYRDFDTAAKAALAERLKLLDAVGAKDLGLLFDDMRGDQPGLAEAQARITGWVADHTSASRVILCPTYYSDDPVLDRVFGARPPGYLEDLGAALDPAIEVFWTGEEVCSRELGAGHLAKVAEALRRKPFIWDNYPVNDGPRMSPYLHLRAFTGRPAHIASEITAHGVNPALQPILSRIPMLSLAESYREGDAYAYGAAFHHAAVEVLGADLAREVGGRLYQLQDSGLDGLDDKAKARLRERFERFDTAPMP
jgi:hyaluronoglucosaminidase